MPETRALPSLRDYVLLALFALVMIAPGLSALPPVDRDESRYAVASTQMLNSGDFVDIRYQDIPRHLQPAGIYWLQAGAVAALSDPDNREIWAFRVPSLLNAIAASLLTAWLAGALFGRMAGVTAGVLLASCLSVNFEGRIAKIDASLLAAVTAAMAALAQIYLDRATRPRVMAALFWAAMGVGLLLKGPIPMIFVGGAIAMLVAWDRRAAWLKRLHAGWGVPLMLAIAAPWYIAIAQVDPDFFNRAIGKNLLGKVAKSQQAHGGPFGYHLALFPAMFWPGALFAALAVPFVWRGRGLPEVRFLIAWIIPGWIVYELVATKLPHYVLPTYPAIAILAAGALFAPRGVAPIWARALGAGFALLWLAVSGVIAGLGPYVLHEYQGGVDGPTLAAALFGFAVAVAVLVLALRHRPVAAVGAAALSALVLHVNTFANALPRVDTLWASPRIVAAAEAVKPCPNSRLVTTPYHEPSLVFLNGPFETVLAKSAEEAVGTLAADRACAVALIGHERRADFLKAARLAGLEPRAMGTITGRNYSDGGDLDLTLYLAQ